MNTFQQPLITITRCERPDEGSWRTRMGASGYDIRNVDGRLRGTVAFTTVSYWNRTDWKAQFRYTGHHQQHFTEIVMVNTHREVLMYNQAELIARVRFVT